MSAKAPMLRLAPIDFKDLPGHPSFNDETPNKRPELLEFAVALLDQGRSLTLATEFNLRFKSHSWKPSPPSNNEVEILSATIPSSTLESIPWSSETVLRPKPAKLNDEHWYARRSYHHNLSVKHNSPGTASWSEFVYGIRDHHSKHEHDFTPTIYDARLITDWTEPLNAALATLSRTPTSTDHHHPPETYTHATMALYEMCHQMPNIVGPRCFPVLVVTASASASDSEFLAVTLPVDLRACPAAFYSTGQNRKEGTDSQTRKSVTLADYVAVERVHRYAKLVEHRDRGGKTHSHEQGEGGTDEEIEWLMCTASHARGNIPVVAQRMGVPGAIAKDVGLFLKWIRKVPDEEVRSQEVGVSTARSGEGAGKK